MKKGTSQFDKSAIRLLERLAAGEQRGSETALDAEAGILLRADLASRCDNGRIGITDAGRAHLARLAAASRNSTIDPYLAQHLALAGVPAGGGVGAMFDEAESPLMWLARRKGKNGRSLIEPHHLQAGERMRADFTFAQLMPRTTANWSSPVADR